MLKNNAKDLILQTLTPLTKVAGTVTFKDGTTTLGTGTMPRVLGNSNQLLQAFLRAVENAVDALQEAGGGSLQVSLRQENAEVDIEFAGQRARLTRSGTCVRSLLYDQAGRQRHWFGTERNLWSRTG